MPFLSEEIWSRLHGEQPHTDCVVSAYPTQQTFNSQLLQMFALAQDIVTGVRDMRNKQSIKMAEKLVLVIEDSKTAQSIVQDEGVVDLIIKLANLTSFTLPGEGANDGFTFITGAEKLTVLSNNKEIDYQSLLADLESQKKYQEGFVKSVLGKLNNPKFVSGAPEDVVNKERQKLADGEQRIKILAEEIENIRKIMSQ